MSGSTALVINSVAIIIFAGIILGKLSDRIKIPKMVLLILAGVIYSLVDSSHLVNFDDELVKDIALTLAELALIIVLFQEGMHLHLRTLGKNILPVMILAVIGTVITASLVGLSLSFIATGRVSAEFSAILVTSLLLAAIIVPTDPAATISILKSSGGKVKKNIETIMSGESAFNDVIAILLVIILLLPKVVERNYSLDMDQEIITEALWQFFGGILLGLVVAILILFFINRYRTDTEFSYITMVGAFSIFIISPIIHVSMALAALIAGIIVQNPRFVLMKKKYREESIHAFWDTIAYLIEILSFVFIGLLINPYEYSSYLMGGVILAFIAMFSRLISVFVSTTPLEFTPWTAGLLSNKDRIFISFAGFKGLTTAVLALFAYVELVHVDEFLANLILFSSIIMILVSGISQGLLLPFITKKTGVLEES